VTQDEARVGAAERHGYLTASPVHSEVASGRSEPSTAARKGNDGKVLQCERLCPLAREVDDDVRALGRREEEALAPARMSALRRG